MSRPTFAKSNRVRTISTGGGVEPLWAPTGEELFYRAGDKLIVVAADTRAGFAHGLERVLFEGRYKLDGLDSRNYDVTSDGQLFLMLRHTNEAASEPLHVVTNWFREVRQLTSGQ